MLNSFLYFFIINFRAISLFKTIHKQIHKEYYKIKEYLEKISPLF